MSERSTAAYVAAYQRTYDAARAEGHGPDAARYAANKAADAARDEMEKHEAGNELRRKLYP